MLTCLFSSPESVHRHRPPRSQWEESEGFGHICLRTGLLQGTGSQSTSLIPFEVNFEFSWRLSYAVL